MNDEKKLIVSAGFTSEGAAMDAEAAKAAFGILDIAAGIKPETKAERTWRLRMVARLNHENAQTFDKVAYWNQCREREAAAAVAARNRRLKMAAAGALAVAMVSSVVCAFVFEREAALIVAVAVFLTALVIAKAVFEPAADYHIQNK